MHTLTRQALTELLGALTIEHDITHTRWLKEPMPGLRQHLQDEGAALKEDINALTALLRNDTLSP